jgi:hypothetical protein
VEVVNNYPWRAEDVEYFALIYWQGGATSAAGDRRTIPNRNLFQFIKLLQ